MARRCRGTVAPGALLVGDAAEFVDPFTGEGLYIAMRSAELAAPVIADALAAGRVDRAMLNRFDAVRRDEFGEKYRMCWRIQKHLYTPWLANYVVRRLAANPALADALAAVTGDYAPPASIGWRFYWSLLNPFAGRRTAHAG
jgi:flavin-dependent dehydrogenase